MTALPKRKILQSIRARFGRARGPYGKDGMTGFSLPELPVQNGVLPLDAP